MGRSDDSISRRRNKRIRKKQDENSNQVSTRVAALIAAKKRRLTGKRRMCQGMCFSLPTMEDPYNEKLGKKDFVKKSKKPDSKVDKTANNVKSLSSKKRTSDNDHGDVSLQAQKKAKAMRRGNEKRPVKKSSEDGQMAIARLGEGKTLNNSVIKIDPYCPSKFLITCLDEVEKSLKKEGNLSTGKPFFVHPWGIEFWSSYSHGKDVIETSCGEARVEQIAWIAATSTDAIARKEKEGQSFAGPFLIFLAPSQERASKVRQICKSLKDCGIRTVSLHSGASIDHQILGLKSCEPEFVISTPERLLELVSLNAIDITGVSMLVIEKPETVSQGGYSNAIESIKKCIPASSQKVVFSDSQ